MNAEVWAGSCPSVVSAAQAADRPPVAEATRLTDRRPNRLTARCTLHHPHPFPFPVSPFPYAATPPAQPLRRNRLSHLPPPWQPVCRNGHLPARICCRRDPRSATGAGMSFYPQPNSYECGPFALKHALAVVGEFTDERALAARAGTTAEGTDEVQLARAAMRHACVLPTIRATDPDGARSTLEHQLGDGHPVLACVDEWQHWLVIAAQEGDRFVVLDSAEPAVFSIVEWSELRERWAFPIAADGGTRPVFDLNPLKPRHRRRQWRARITEPRVRYLVNGGAELARDWSTYARDLLELGAAARGVEDDPAVVPMTRVLEANCGALLDRVDGRGPSYRDAAARVLDRIACIADAYDVHVLPRHRAEALRTAEALMRTVSGIRKVGG